MCFWIDEILSFLIQHYRLQRISSWLEEMTPQLLIWSSETTNNITMARIDTKQKYADFAGAQLDEGFGSQNHP